MRCKHVLQHVTSVVCTFNSRREMQSQTSKRAAPFRNIKSAGSKVIISNSSSILAYSLDCFKMLRAKKISNAVMKSTLSSLTCSSLYSSILRELLSENADDGNAIYEVWERAGAGQETLDNKVLSAISSGERFAIF